MAHAVLLREAFEDFIADKEHQGVSQRTVTVLVTRSRAVMSVDAWSLRVPLSSKHAARRANGVRLKKAEERLGRKILVRHSADHA